MKYLLIPFLIFFLTPLVGQELEFSDDRIVYEDEEVAAVVVTMRPSAKDIRKALENWLQDTYEVNLNDKKFFFFEKEYMTASGIQIPKIASTKIDLKVKVDDKDSAATRLSVFASFGYDNWITPQYAPYEYAMLRDIVEEFTAEYLPAYYQNRIDRQKERIEELADNKSDLIQDLEKNRERMKELQNENAMLLKQIRENQDEIRMNRSKLMKEKNRLDKVQQKVDHWNNRK